jgi:hypothetical protein
MTSFRDWLSTIDHTVRTQKAKLFSFALIARNTYFVGMGFVLSFSVMIGQLGLIRTWLEV